MEKTKYIRYLYEEIISYGIVENNLIHKIESNYLTNIPIKTGDEIKLTDVKILPPVNPSKVIGLAYNYKDLVGECQKYPEPLIFIKPNTSVIGTGDIIEIPDNKIVWGEVELAIVVGKKAKNIIPERSNSYIFGYTIANDVTMQNIEARDHHLARSKGCDTFCPIGPWIIPNLNTSDLSLVNKINSEIFQMGNTSNRIINDLEAVSLVSKFITLYPGDVIITGTPKNAMNSLLFDGSEISVSIQNIGTLTNSVRMILK